MKCDVLVFDASNAAHRISSATPPLTNAKGERTEVMFGLLRLISHVLRTNPASEVILCYDGKGSRAMRQKIDPVYKDRRGKDFSDDDKERIASMHAQVETFWDLFGQYLPITWLVSNKYEADDIMAMIAHTRGRMGEKVIVVTGDKDLLQVVSPTVTVLSPNTGKYCTAANMEEYTKGYPTGRAWLNGKVIQGEPPTGDNIPGIKGVGEVTALRFLKQHDFDIVDLLSNPCEEIVNSKVGKAIICVEGRARISKNYKLMSLLSPFHQTFKVANIDVKKGTMNKNKLRENMVKQKFASLMASFHEFITPFLGVK